MSTPTSPPPVRQVPGWVQPAFRWLTVINVILIVVQAFVASEGIWGGTPDLIKRHGEVGNLVFLLIVVQGVMAFMLANSGDLPRIAVVLGVLAVILVFVQIGLGYSTRDNVKLTVWHVTNGVLLMGVLAGLAAITWARPTGPGRS